MSCGVGRRCSLDPSLLWLWHRLAATALIRPLIWEPPYAMGVAQEKGKNKTKQKINSIWIKDLNVRLDTMMEKKMLNTSDC